MFGPSVQHWIWLFYLIVERGTHLITTRVENQDQVPSSELKFVHDFRFALTKSNTRQWTSMEIVTGTSIVRVTIDIYIENYNRHQQIELIYTSMDRVTVDIYGESYYRHLL